MKYKLSTSLSNRDLYPQPSNKRRYLITSFFGDICDSVEMRGVFALKSKSNKTLSTNNFNANKTRFQFGFIFWSCKFIHLNSRRNTFDCILGNFSIAWRFWLFFFPSATLLLSCERQMHRFSSPMCNSSLRLFLSGANPNSNFFIKIKRVINQKERSNEENRVHIPGRNCAGLT